MAQNGTAVTMETRPSFTGFLNIDFPEKTEHANRESIPGESGNIVTETGTDLTTTVSGTLVLKSGTTAPAPFDVLTTGESPSRKFLVLSVSRPRQAGKAVRFSVDLKLSESVTLA